MRIQVNRLFLLYVFLIQSVFIFSQENDFKTHTAETGESLFQIARRYNTSLNVIYELNPEYRDQILKIGDVIKVPLNGSNLNEQTISNDDYIVITIVRGDTKFAISKKYGVSISTLEQLNPQIVNMLLIGQRVKIPKNKSNLNTNSNSSTNNTTTTNDGDYLVKKGETLWGIAKSNNISVKLLMDANKDRLDGILKAGQYLRIPNDSKSSSYTSVSNNASIPNNESGAVIYHIVEAGETKFGLSKKYQMTIKELEDKNPHIIPMLMVGHKLMINGVENQSNYASENIITNVPETIPNNSNEISTEVKNEENISTDYVDYVVQSQETLFGLAKKASMTQEDLIKLNPDLQNGVNVGMTIKMPKNTKIDSETPQPAVVTNPTTTSENLVFNANLIDYPSNVQYSEINKSLNFNKEINVTFIFSEEVATLSEFALENDEQKIALEQYRGVFLAIDTLKSLGAKINASFLNTKSNDFISKSWKETFLKSDIIFGNYDTFRFEEVLSFAKEQNKKIIVPTKQAKLEEDSNVIYAYPNELHQKIFMINYMKSLNANILIVTDAIDSDNANFLRSYDSSIKFAPLDSRGVVNNDRFRLMFDKNKINFVVLDTDKNSLIISSTNFLLGESNNYGIRLALFKSRELINSPDVSDIRLKVLQMVYPSVINPNEAQITKFKELYINKYDKSPSKEAKISFDIALDVMARLIQENANDDFSKVNTKQEHMKFQYQNYKNSFWNAGIFIIRYE